ncbi:hypothetical protein J9303_10210 [Bacillaceae bacterium Marseille-Q3522]|nr:hypothetical protein [Bacillaceae bacterium Marseille-Q3522]
MKIRVGVVGPKGSVQRISHITKHFEELDIILLPYDKVEDTLQIITKNKSRVNQWLFSGQVPYYYALKNGFISKEEASYPTLYGSSLLGSLLHACHQENVLLSSISLDTVQKATIEMVQEDLHLQEIKIFSYPYNGYVPSQEIVDFHMSLFENGEVQAVFTCLETVYSVLRGKNIPCYRVYPSVLVIHQTLELLMKQGQSKLYRNKQLAILGIEILEDKHYSDDNDYSYEARLRELALKQLLVYYAKLVQGSFVQMGDALFFIYTTRGELEAGIEEKSLLQILDDAYLHSKLYIRIGVGYGVTANEAEQHVRLALKYARKHKVSKLVIVNEEKEIMEQSGEINGLFADQRLNDERWEKVGRIAKISPNVLSKIEGKAVRQGKEVVTTQELSQWLNGTERNAQRIITQLESAGLAKVIGIKHSGGRGRPRKVYKLHFLKK